MEFCLVCIWKLPKSIILQLLEYFWRHLNISNLVPFELSHQKKWAKLQILIFTLAIFWSNFQILQQRALEMPSANPGQGPYQIFFSPSSRINLTCLYQVLCAPQSCALCHHTWHHSADSVAHVKLEKNLNMLVKELILVAFLAITLSVEANPDEVSKNCTSWQAHRLCT